ncbi:metal-dependent phosphohydrolase [Candidatus Woesearchaeota archaeon]|nr:metal-dependent phosphohydrolase [Candidatus Woesearchaeota archaeon]
MKDSVEQNRASIIALLEQTGREGIDGLVEWLDNETDYFTAPASSRPGYHGCHEGGLAEHSANVYTIFHQKMRQFDLGIKDDELVIASLLHDLCKVNQYRPNVLKSGALSEAKPYVIEDNLPLGHGEKSVYLATQYIDLTPAEALLMRWHMGPFDEAWEQWEPRVGKACPAIYAFHSADQEASKYLDVRVTK